MRRWPGTQVPVVTFVNGREQEVCPAMFTAQYSQLGACTRLQVLVFDLDLFKDNLINQIIN